MAVAAHYVRGRHALVTGGSEGIGFALARRMAMSGARVTLLARDRLKLERARAALEEQVPGALVRVVALDVADAALVRSTLPSALGDAALDILVNNAGVSRPGQFLEISNEAFRRQIDVNFWGAVEVTRALLPRLGASPYAHIVNIGSVSSVVATVGHPAYAASKFALYGFSDSLRAELAPLGVRVSIVLPPETTTKMLDEERAHLTMAALALQRTAGRLSPDTVARAILRGMAAGKFEIIPGILARATVLAFRMFPSGVRAYADWVVRSQADCRTP
jgi:3-dehydrosphinganine reductase